jgi:hypothetical protein
MIRVPLAKDVPNHDSKGLVAVAKAIFLTKSKANFVVCWGGGREGKKDSSCYCLPTTPQGHSCGRPFCHHNGRLRPVGVALAVIPWPPMASSDVYPGDLEYNFLENIEVDICMTFPKMCSNNSSS